MPVRLPHPQFLRVGFAQNDGTAAGKRRQRGRAKARLYNPVSEHVLGRQRAAGGVPSSPFTEEISALQPDHQNKNFPLKKASGLSILDRLNRLNSVRQQNRFRSEGYQAMANPFVHVELNTTDVNKAKAFYGKLFDWKLEDVDMGSGLYTIIKVGEATAGGILKHPVPGAPSAWLAYVLVEDIAAATQKAKSLGATVMQDVTEVMGVGWFSVFVDPTGAALALFKPKTA
jgi:uncharacterized protein